MNYVELLKQNAEMAKTLQGEPFRILVLSNITVNPLKEILEFTLRSAGLPAEVACGDYDNVLQQAHLSAEYEATVIFYDLCNIIEGSYYRIDGMSDQEREALVANETASLDLLFAGLANAPLVVMNTFSSLPFSHRSLARSPYDSVCEQLNLHLRTNAPQGLVLAELDRVLGSVSIDRALDMRMFYSSMLLYTNELLLEYARHIAPAFLAVAGKRKKALIFDCDNTLWKGILGEDGFQGIQMAPDSHKGRPFHEVQHLALGLSEQGVILGLCSKNNLEDVEDVLESHPDMVLGNNHISVKRVNWSDKVSNLLEIAKELNISMDSLVFVDDSEFEIDLVRQQLPEVTCIQVPKAAHGYPRELRNHLGLFHANAITEEDRVKARRYRQQAARARERERFGTLEEYLRSLGLAMAVSVNDQALVPRMAQMTQKVNQFNMTTRRYTERDIMQFVADPGMLVMAVGVRDRFGDNGVTGLAIVRTDRETAFIDTFLMSCRIIGRNIERAFMDALVQAVEGMGCLSLVGEYIPSQKNQQVAALYKELGFSQTPTDNAGASRFSVRVQDYEPSEIDYIEVRHEAR